jgi:hypothetical protein
MMRRYSPWLVLFTLIFVMMTGGCGGGGGGGDGGEGGGSIDGTWKIYAIIDDDYNAPIMMSSGLTITVTRNSETGEIRLSGNDVRYDTYSQGAIEITANGNTYLMRGVPSSEEEEIDESLFPSSVDVRAVQYSYSDVTFTHLTGSSVTELLDYQVWGYKIEWVRN